MKRLTALVLLIAGCSSIPSARYEGGLVWGFDSMHDQAKCEKGRVIYEGYHVYTNFVLGQQCADLRWQCIGPGFNDYHQVSVPCIDIPNKK